MSPGPARLFAAASALAGALMLAELSAACSRPQGAGGPLPGDSLSQIPQGRPVAGESAATNADSDGASPAAPVATGLAGVCPADHVSPERLPLEAGWRHGHVRVHGTVPAGAGKTLNLGLSQHQRFVFDEVFRGERLASVRLRSDSVDLVSVGYAPTESEDAALSRSGAVALDRGAPVCVTASLYDGLTLVAVNQIPLPAPGD